MGKIWDGFMEFLGVAQKKADEGVQVVAKEAVVVGKVVDDVAHKAAAKVEEVMKPVNELGAKIGSKKGRKGARQDPQDAK